MKGISVLEVNAPLWCAGFASKKKGSAGTLDAVPDSAVADIASKGYDALWLMGAWTRGTRSKEIAQAHEGLRRDFDAALPGWTAADITSSPFSICQYRTAPGLGGDEAMQRFRKRLNKKGLSLILDFVPNHTACDHPWVTSRPDLYVCAPEGYAPDRPWNFFQADTSAGRKTIAHGRDPFFDGWTDTAQLDYRNTETRSAMIEELAAISRSCDGLRCDMAMLVLADVFKRTWDHVPFPGGEPANCEFWSESLDAVRKEHPGFIFTAEAYWGLENRLAELGFDYVYDKILLDALIRRDIRQIDGMIGRDPQGLDWGLRFLENHDEERAAKAFQPESQPACAVVALTLPGARLLQDGQAEGARTRLPVQMSRRPAEEPDPAASALYSALLPVLASETLKSGQWRRLEPRNVSCTDWTSSNLLAWRWELQGRSAVLCAANLSQEQSKAWLPVQIRGLRDRITTWKDALDGTVYVRDGDELCDVGLYVQLDPGKAHVLVLEDMRPKRTCKL